MKKNKKNPFLKIRYVTGLGDLVACILHSKFINPITHAITKNESQCEACHDRQRALNILFPFRLTKLFFSSLDEQKKSFYKEAKEYGYDVPEKLLSESKEEECCENPKDETESEIIINNQNEINGDTVTKSPSQDFSDYNLIQKFITDQENLKIVISFYKKIDI